MAAPTLVLDANALADRGFQEWLRHHQGRRVLPIVAYAEAEVKAAAAGRLEAFRSLLTALGIEIEWMRAEQADRAVASANVVGDFARNARDHFVAGHVREGRILVSFNKRDFTFLAAVKTPHEVMTEFRSEESSGLRRRH